MATQEDLTIVVRAAAAAAIVSLANLPKALVEKVEKSGKFVVHPHVATVEVNDPLLTGYLRRIYSGGKSLGAAYPVGNVFAKLAVDTTVGETTRALADALAISMANKNANAGILFGFLIDVDGRLRAHGVVKADLDDEQRFHFQSRPNGEWSLGEVRDMLPPPRADYAKFAIAPQPLGEAAIGVHDITDASTAADYFLEAVGLTVPRTTGTKALVAQAALEAGYRPDEVQAKLQAMTADTAVEQMISESFPNIPTAKVGRLGGSPTRPMPLVKADDPYIRVFRTQRPHFVLEVDDTVDVKIEGRTITVTLPSESDAVEPRARRR